jgi:hypothetical protein
MAIVGASDERAARGLRMRQVVHMAAPAAENCQRKAVRDRLAVHHQIRRHCGQLAVAAERVSKSGLDLIKDKQEAEFIRERSQPGKISAARANDADVLQHRLGNESRYRIASAYILHRFEIVKIDRMHQMLLEHRGASPNRTQRIFSRRNPRTDFRQGVEHIAGHFIVIAVIAALNDDDVLPAGHGAAQLYRQGRGFTAGVEQAGFLDRGDVLTQQLRQMTLQSGWSGAKQTLAVA